ncbi:MULTISPECIES: CPBP family glutamic-type intramembrane protease [Staphylococcus]
MYKFSNILIYTIIFILVFYFFDDFKLTLFYLTIAMGEEYLFREVVYKILLNNFSFINSIIIGSLLFSLLLHLNESIITNLLIRFPSSILLYLLRYAFGLRASISVHWIYNILVSKVIG